MAEGIYDGNGNALPDDTVDALIPGGFQQRLRDGKRLDALLQAGTSQAAKDFGPEPFPTWGVSQDTEKGLEALGINPKPGQLDPLRLINKFTIDTVATGFNSVVRTLSAGGGFMSGMLAHATAGIQTPLGQFPPEEQGANDLDLFQQLAGIIAGTQVGRVERLPGGNARTQAIGGLPRDGDFYNANVAVLSHPKAPVTFSDVLNHPNVRNAINNVEVDRTGHVPYEAGASTVGDTTHIDKSIPPVAELPSGAKFDTATPLKIHEQVEKFVMEKLTAAGMPDDVAYRVAHWEFAEKAEDAWYRAQGIDPEEAEKWWIERAGKIDHDNVSDVSPNLYDKPYPHDSVSLARGGGVETQKPTAAEITEAQRLLSNGSVKFYNNTLYKLNDLWNNYGVHPSEVIADMQRDPVLAAEMMSSVETVPTKYTDGVRFIPDWDNWTKEANKAITTRTLPNGEVVPAPGAVAGYLEEFGRRAGFRFHVSQAQTLQGGDNTPAFYRKEFERVMPNGKKEVIRVQGHVHMPDTPDYLTKQWYGLGRSEVLYHEVGHALDYFVLNAGKNKTTSEALLAQLGRLHPGLLDEIKEAQKRWYPYLTGTDPIYKARSAEQMADAIGAWLSNPEIRKDMPIFTKLFGKKLDPFREIAEQALPVYKEGKWQRPPPHEEEPPPGSAEALKYPPAGGGGGLPPDTPRWWEDHWEEPRQLEGPTPDLTAAHEYMRKQISTGEASPKRSYSFSRFYTDFMDKFFPAAKLVKQAAVSITHAADDPYKMLRLFADWAGKAHVFLRQEQFDFHSYEKVGPSLEEILEPVKDDLERFNHFMVAARGLELERRGINSGLDVNVLKQLGTKAYIAKYGPVMEQIVKYQNNVTKYLRDSGVLSDKAYAQMLQANKLFVPFHRVLEDPDFFEHAGIGKNNLQSWNPVRTIKGSDRRIIDPMESIVRNTYLLMALATKNEVGQKLIAVLDRAGALAGKTPEIAKLPAVVPDVKGAVAELGSVTQDMHDLNNVLAGAKHMGGTDTISVYQNGHRVTYRVGEDIANMMKGLDQDTVSKWERMMRPFANALRAGAVLDPAFQMRHLFRDMIYATVTTAKGAFTPLNMADGFLSAFLQDKYYWEWRKSGGGQASFGQLNRNWLQNDLRELTGQSGLFTRAWNVVTDPNATWLQKGGAILGLPVQAVSKLTIHPLRVGTEIVTSASHLGAFKKSLRDLERERTANAYERTPLTPNLPAVINKPERETTGLPAKGEYQLAPGVTPKQAFRDTANKRELIESAWVSRDTAVDAARMGAKMSSMNAIAAFSNIALQDSDRIVRAIKDNPIKTLSLLAATITVPSLSLWAVNHGDSRYESLPAWERDAFWIILTDKWEAPSDIEAKAIQTGNDSRPTDQFRVIDGKLMVNNGSIFRLPKPFQAGIVFGAMPERLADEFYQHRPHAFEGLMGSVLTAGGGETMLPNMVSPIANQMNNRDLFTGRTIVPSYAENFLPEYQYTPYTSDTAKVLGKLFSSFPGMEKMALGGGFTGGVAHALTSPALIDNYVRGWSGNLGQYAMEISSAALRKAGIAPSVPKPEWRLSDIPVVRSFVARYPGATSDNIDDFFSAFGVAKAYHDTLTGQAKKGDVQAVQALANSGYVQQYEALQGINKALNTQLKVIRWINENPQIQSYEKRQLLDQLYFGALRTVDQGTAVLQQLQKVQAQ